MHIDNIPAPFRRDDVETEVTIGCARRLNKPRGQMLVGKHFRPAFGNRGKPHKRHVAPAVDFVWHCRESGTPGRIDRCDLNGAEARQIVKLDNPAVCNPVQNAINPDFEYALRYIRIGGGCDSGSRG